MKLIALHNFPSIWKANLILYNVVFKEQNQFWEISKYFLENVHVFLSAVVREFLPVSGPNIYINNMQIYGSLYRNTYI